jgi:carboxymethylenebutenolidase
MFRDQQPVPLSSWSAGVRDVWVLAGLMALTVCALPAGGQPVAQEAGEVKESVATFKSAGRPIQARWFEPAAAGKRPAVVLLHGADGPKAGEALYRFAAGRLAVRGYRVLLVHYFDRTGAAVKGAGGVADLFKKCLDGTATKREEAIARARFREWAAAVCDAVAYARSQPGVDEERVGLVGFSLGAYLALAVAADERQHIAAVVEFCGGLVREARAGHKSLPPVLGFHGDKDQTVPVKEAESLRDLLAGRDPPCKVQIYKGVGHVFRKDGQVQPAIVVDAESQAAAFLEEHLKRGKRPARE